MQTGHEISRPRFRQDLVAEPIDDAGARFIDVMDPDSGNVFRFFEVEYSLACAMDGERDVPGIVQWAKEELGLTPSATEVRTVIATLGDLGYLEAGAAAAAAASTSREPAPAARPAGVPTVKNHWDDAPTTITNADDDLGVGVVVGNRRAATPVADVELGNAGTSSASASADAPSGASFELGQPGTASRPPRAPDRTQVDDIGLGVPGRADVSVDLSDGVGIGVDDVKEAVRASQVMKAVDVPKELLDSLEAEPDKTAKPAGKPSAKAAEPASKPAAKPVDAAPAHKPVAAPVHKAVDVAPKAAAKPAVEPTKAPNAPTPAVSPALLVLLAVVVFGAIAFIVYKFVLKKAQTQTDDVQSNATPAQHVQPQPPAKPPEPPPPAVESVKLATSADTTATLKPVAAGQIDTIASDAAVKPGDVIVRFVGHKPIETEVAGLQRDIEKRVKPELAQAEKDRDAAQTSNNKALLTAAEGRIADRKKSLDDKQTKLAQKQADLEKLVIRAPAAGKLTAKAKAGVRVSPNDVVALIAVEPVRIAKFAKAPSVAAKSRVLLVTKADHKNLSCVVSAADPGGLTIECPADAAAEGTEVTYGGLDPTPPPAPTNTEIEMGDEPKGSASVAPPPPPPPAPAPHPTAAPRPAPHPAPHPAPAPDKGSAEAAPAPAPAPAGSATE